MLFRGIGGQVRLETQTWQGSRKSRRVPVGPKPDSHPSLLLLKYPEGYLEALANREREKENSKREEEEEQQEGGFTSPRTGKGKWKRKSAGEHLVGVGWASCVCGSRWVSRGCGVGVVWTWEQVGVSPAARATRPSLGHVPLPHMPRPLPGGGPSRAVSPRRSAKKSKVEPYSLTAQQSSLIREDKSNAKLWNEVLASLKDRPASGSPVGTRGSLVVLICVDCGKMYRAYLPFSPFSSVQLSGTEHIDVVVQLSPPSPPPELSPLPKLKPCPCETVTCTRSAAPAHPLCGPGTPCHPTFCLHLPGLLQSDPRPRSAK